MEKIENKIFEIKSFARIQQAKACCWFNISEKINFFDKIFFEEKNTSKWWIQIKNIWKIKIPTNAENSCFLATKEMQREFAKKNKWTKPNTIIITIEKNIPINSWLWWASWNWFEVLKFLNNFWEINCSEEKILDLYEKVFWEKFLIPEKNFSDKKILILIPKYISVEEEFFKKILNKNSSFNLSKEEKGDWNFFSDAQKKIKNIFPDLKKFIKIFLENWAEFSDISWRWWAVFWVFDEKKSEGEFSELKNIFEKFWKIILV